MTVYECDLAVLHQHEQALRDAATRARLRRDGEPFRVRLARVLRQAADRVEPARAPKYRRGVSA